MRHYLEEQLKAGRLYNSIMIQSSDAKATLGTLQDFIKQSLLGEQIDLENHPEFKLVTSEKGEAILVDQIRELQEFLYKTASIAPFKIAVIVPADLMNTNAANSCLKILEDTPKNTYIFLIVNNLACILPTIRSRCIKIRHSIQDNAGQNLGLYEQDIKMAAGLDEKTKLDFLQELTTKNKELWLEFAKNIHFFITKLAKKTAGVNVNLSSTEEQIMGYFGDMPTTKFLEKAENIEKIINDTVEYDLDLRSNFVLIAAQFENDLR